MNHSAEIKIHRYLEDVRKSKRGMSPDTIARIVKDVKESVEKQFNQSERKFTLRMSNIGRPYCQLWYDKNAPEEGVEPSANFLMNMMIGDIVEAVFKGVLTEAGVDFSDGFKSTLNLGKHKIDGTHDLIMDKRVDDIKSASPWSYKNKFKDYYTLRDHDSFGYVGQLAGYSQSLGVDIGGWWVINKATRGQVNSSMCLHGTWLSKSRTSWMTSKRKQTSLSLISLSVALNLSKRHIVRNQLATRC